VALIKVAAAYLVVLVPAPVYLDTIARRVSRSVGDLAKLHQGQW
jgi:hypothetical protein